MLNDSTVKALRKLKDNTGNYIWSPSVQAGVPDTILNRPYKTSSYVPEIPMKSAITPLCGTKPFPAGQK